ncbi:MAG: GDSL-type esterase/lipase family protein [Nocardioides sp.]
MAFHRYVALGDSFTEGVGDPDPPRPNGLRGWADRVAEALAATYDEALGRLAGTGATVGIFTAFDPGRGGPFGRLRGRFALYNEAVREIADRHGAVVLDAWRMRPANPETLWSPDRLHLGPAGHQAVAIAVLATLGVPHSPRARRRYAAGARSARRPGLDLDPRRTLGAPAADRPLLR